MSPLWVIWLLTVTRENIREPFSDLQGDECRGRLRVHLYVRVCLRVRVGYNIISERVLISLSPLALCLVVQKDVTSDHFWHTIVWLSAELNDISLFFLFFLSPKRNSQSLVCYSFTERLVKYRNAISLIQGNYLGASFLIRMKKLQRHRWWLTLVKERASRQRSTAAPLTLAWWWLKSFKRSRQRGGENPNYPPSLASSSICCECGGRERKEREFVVHILHSVWIVVPPSNFSGIFGICFPGLPMKYVLLKERAKVCFTPRPAFLACWGLYSARFSGIIATAGWMIISSGPLYLCTETSVVIAWVDHCLKKEMHDISVQ